MSAFGNWAAASTISAVAAREEAGQEAPADAMTTSEAASLPSKKVSRVKKLHVKRLSGARLVRPKKVAGPAAPGDRPTLAQVCGRSLKRAFVMETPLPLVALEVALAVVKRRRLHLHD